MIQYIVGKKASSTENTSSKPLRAILCGFKSLAKRIDPCQSAYIVQADMSRNLPLSLFFFYNPKNHFISLFSRLHRILHHTIILNPFLQRVACIFCHMAARSDRALRKADVLFRTIIRIFSCLISIQHVYGIS